MAPERTLWSTLRRDSLDMVDKQSLQEKGSSGEGGYFFGGLRSSRGGGSAFLGSSTPFGQNMQYIRLYTLFVLGAHRPSSRRLLCCFPLVIPQQAALSFSTEWSAHFQLSFHRKHWALAQFLSLFPSQILKALLRFSENKKVPLLSDCVRRIWLPGLAAVSSQSKAWASVTRQDLQPAECSQPMPTLPIMSAWQTMSSQIADRMPKREI